MTRRTPKLDDEVPQGFCQVNPVDAAKEKIHNRDIVRLKTRRGSIETEARVTHEVPEGLVFVPFHFSESCANQLTNPVLDSACGMPEYKVCAVKVEVIQ